MSSFTTFTFSLFLFFLLPPISVILQGQRKRKGGGWSKSAAVYDPTSSTASEHSARFCPINNCQKFRCSRVRVMSQTISPEIDTFSHIIFLQSRPVGANFKALASVITVLLMKGGELYCLYEFAPKIMKFCFRLATWEVAKWSGKYTWLVWC